MDNKEGAMGELAGTVVSTLAPLVMEKITGGMQTGELYDLREDPYEFSNLWGDPQCRDIREEYVHKCLDASVFTADPLPIRTGRF